MSDTAWTDDDSPLAPLDIQPVGVEWVSVDDMVPEQGRRVPVDVAFAWGWGQTMGYWDGASWHFLSEREGVMRESDTRCGIRGRVVRWFNLPAPERGQV